MVAAKILILEGQVGKLFENFCLPYYSLVLFLTPFHFELKIRLNSVSAFIRYIHDNASRIILIDQVLFPTGFNPVFDETFEFHINLPELALVQFVVQDDDFIGDGFIGQYTIPLSCIQPGEN